jgi:hypothetical protein
VVTAGRGRGWAESYLLRREALRDAALLDAAPFFDADDFDAEPTDDPPFRPLVERPPLTDLAAARSSLLLTELRPAELLMVRNAMCPPGVRQESNASGRHRTAASVTG